MTDWERFRRKGPAWTLGDDSQLVTALESLVTSVARRTERLTEELGQAKKRVDRIDESVNAVNASIGLFSSRQFIEQRVLEDDFKPIRKQSPVNRVSTSVSDRQASALREVKAAIREGLNAVDARFKPLDGYAPDDPFIQYQPVSKYIRQLPPIIGSSAFLEARAKEESTKESTSIPTRASPLTEPSSSHPFPATPAPPPPPPPLPPKLSATVSPIGNALSPSTAPSQSTVVAASNGLSKSTSAATVTSATANNFKKPVDDVPVQKGGSRAVASTKKSIFDYDSEDDDIFAKSFRSSRSATEERKQRGEEDSKSARSFGSSASENKGTTSVAAVTEEKLPVETDTSMPVHEKAPIGGVRPHSALAAQIAAAIAARQEGREQTNPPQPAKPEKTLQGKTHTATPPQPSLPPSKDSGIAQLQKVDQSAAPQRVANPSEPPIPSKMSANQKKAPGKSIFDDSSDSDSDLFKPAATRKPSTLKKENGTKPTPAPTKQAAPQPKSSTTPEIESSLKANEAKPVDVPTAPISASTTAKKPPLQKSLFDSDSDLDDLFKPNPKRAAAVPATPTAARLPHSSTSNSNGVVVAKPSQPLPTPNPVNEKKEEERKKEKELVVPAEKKESISCQPSTVGLLEEKDAHQGGDEEKKSERNSAQSDCDSEDNSSPSEEMFRKNPNFKNELASKLALRNPMMGGPAARPRSEVFFNRPVPDSPEARTVDDMHAPRHPFARPLPSRQPAQMVEPAYKEQSGLLTSLNKGRARPPCRRRPAPGANAAEKSTAEVKQSMTAEKPASHSMASTQSSSTLPSKGKSDSLTAIPSPVPRTSAAHPPLSPRKSQMTKANDDDPLADILEELENAAKETVSQKDRTQPERDQLPASSPSAGKDVKESSKRKKNTLFDMDSEDDFSSPRNVSKTLPASLPPRTPETAKASGQSPFKPSTSSTTSTSKPPASSSGTRSKGIFDDSDEDYSLFIRKK